MKQSSQNPLQSFQQIKAMFGGRLALGMSCRLVVHVAPEVVCGRRNERSKVMLQTSMVVDDEDQE